MARISLVFVSEIFWWRRVLVVLKLTLG